MVQKVCSVGKKNSTSDVAFSGASEPCRGFGAVLPSTKKLVTQALMGGEGRGGGGAVKYYGEEGRVIYFSSSSELPSICLHFATASSLARHSAIMGPLSGGENKNSHHIFSYLTVYPYLDHVSGERVVEVFSLGAPCRTLQLLPSSESAPSRKRFQTRPL